MAKLFRKILVPHDFSDHATRALEVAATLAAAQGGKVTVLHVVTPDYAGLGFSTHADITRNLPAQTLREIQTRLESVVRRAIGRRAAGVVCRIAIGHPVEAILDAARRADLIVISTMGRTGLSHLLIGSVAENIVRHASAPVLTIRARGRTGKRPRRAVRHAR
jgi:nucleotide-binding universal stress UspA family protein